jgi:hypothetical protein
VDLGLAGREPRRGADRGDREVAQAQGLNAEHRQARGDGEHGRELEPHGVARSAAIAATALAQPWSSRAPCSRSRRSTAALVLDISKELPADHGAAMAVTPVLGASGSRSERRGFSDLGRGAVLEVATVALVADVGLAEHMMGINAITREHSGQMRKHRACGGRGDPVRQ